MFNYELWTELVHFKMCELNFELVHVETELSQHCPLSSDHSGWMLTAGLKRAIDSRERVSGSSAGWEEREIEERKKTLPPSPVNHISASAGRRWLPRFGCFVPQSHICQSTLIYGERFHIDVHEEQSLEICEILIDFSCQNSIFCFWNLGLQQLTSQHVSPDLHNCFGKWVTFYSNW